MESRNRDRVVSIILRVSLAFSFLYAAVAAFFDPFSWIGFFPRFLSDFAPSDTFLLNSFGIFESMVALLLLFGRGVLLWGVSATAALLLLGIVVFNWGALDIVFRDISLAGAALALAVLHWPQAAKPV